MRASVRAPMRETTGHVAEGAAQPPDAVAANDTGAPAPAAARSSSTVNDRAMERRTSPDADTDSGDSAKPTTPAPGTSERAAPDRETDDAIDAPTLPGLMLAMLGAEPLAPPPAA